MSSLITRGPRALLGLTAVVVVVGLASPPAVATPQDINRARSEVRDLQMQAGTAHELALQSREKLAEVQVQLNSLKVRRSKEQRGLGAIRRNLDSLARSMYVEGAFDPSLQVLLADDPAQFLAQASTLDHLTTTQQATLRQYRTRQLRLAQAEQAVQQEEAKVRAVNAEIATHEADVSARLADAQRVLGRLSATERARLARIEAQRRARQAAEARRESQYVRLPAGAVSSRARAAVKYALGQVGRPYSFSARPPSSWDCSKLTSAAWRQGGVGLTALSYTQWRQTRRIPTSQMRPGDLVFYFGRGAHHVAIYIGNGKVVSASNPSDGVEIIDYLAPWYRERFSGVGRVVG